MKNILMPFIFLFILVAVAPVMAAPASKTHITAEASFIPGNISPGKGWITKGWMQQVKGAISEGTITGDMIGTFRIVSYETVNLKTGEGTNHGRFALTTNGGTFEGSFRSKVTPFGFSGTFVGHGTGVYTGQKIRGSHEGTLTILVTTPLVVMTLDGIILLPKG